MDRDLGKWNKMRICTKLYYYKGIKRNIAAGKYNHLVENSLEGFNRRLKQEERISDFEDNITWNYQVWKTTTQNNAGKWTESLQDL